MDTKISSQRKSEVKDLTPRDTDVKGGATAAATPKLYDAACKGTHIPEVTLF